MEGYGKKLKDLRLAALKSQEEVAEAIGISNSAMSSYENEDRIPRDEVKIKLANYYGTNVSEIFFAGNDTKSDN